MARSSLLIRSLLLSSVLTLASCRSDGIDFSQVDSALEGFIAEHELEGATIVIVHRDRGIVHLRGLGGFDKDRISLIASSSKVLSAGILVRLADQGLLDLDAPISSYLPADWGDHKMTITTAQLLSNSSGMVGLIDNPVYLNYVCQYLWSGSLESCSREIFGADDTADLMPPDTAFRYGGGQWQLAGGVAEAVSGKTWAELVEETYIDPCNLDEDAFGYANQFQDAFKGGIENAFGYPKFFHGDLADLRPTNNPNVEGGAYTTAEDYGKILLMHLRGGRCDSRQVLSEAGVARMQADRIGTVYGGSTIDPTLPGYGLGWWISRTEPGIVADGGAYGASPWLDTERGYGVMVILEGESALGHQVRTLLKPIVESIFDALPE